MLSSGNLLLGSEVSPSCCDRQGGTEGLCWPQCLGKGWSPVTHRALLPSSAAPAAKEDRWQLQVTPFWTAAREVTEPSSVSTCAALWLCWVTWRVCCVLCFPTHLKGDSLSVAPTLLQSLQVTHMKTHDKMHIHAFCSLLFSCPSMSTFENSLSFCVYSHTCTCTYVNPCFFIGR